VTLRLGTLFSRAAYYRAGAAALSYHHHPVADAARIRHRFQACRVARDRAGWAAASAADSAAEVARAAAAAASGDEVEASDVAAEREEEEVAAAEADGAARYYAERTRVAQHSSDPNSPPR
jgi:hypothetical protein